MTASRAGVAERSDRTRRKPTNENDQLPSEHELKFAYNSNGTISSSTDADGHTTTYEYDENGNLKKITPPSGSGISTPTAT